MDRSCYEAIYNKSCCPKCGGCDFDYRYLVSNSPADYHLVKHRFDKICTQCGHSASGRNPDETETNFANGYDSNKESIMNKWNVLFYLNSGNQVEGVYEGHETSSLEVAKNILSDSGKSNKFFGIRVDAAKPTQGFVKINDVSAFFISVYESDKKS